MNYSRGVQQAKEILRENRVLRFPTIRTLLWACK